MRTDSSSHHNCCPQPCCPPPDSSSSQHVPTPTTTIRPGDLEMQDHVIRMERNAARIAELSNLFTTNTTPQTQQPTQSANQSAPASLMRSNSASYQVSTTQRVHSVAMGHFAQIGQTGAAPALSLSSRRITVISSGASRPANIPPSGSTQTMASRAYDDNDDIYN